MDKTKELETILKINDKLIKIKTNNPNDFMNMNMNMKINQSKLSKQINHILKFYISGPSIPSI